MKRKQLIVACAMAALCAGVQDGMAKERGPAKGDHANAVTKHFSIEMGKLIVEEDTFVDGVALRLADGSVGAILTQAPLDACRKLAIALRGDFEVAPASHGDKPVLQVVRDSEHPEGAILLKEPYMTTTLEDKVAALMAGPDRFVVKADVGDAGWGSIDATKYGGKNAPRAHLDIDLPYLGAGSGDPVAADASAEATWLRDLQMKAEAGSSAAASDSLQVGENDYFTESTWNNVLNNWEGLSVIALATDKDCATLLVRAPGFAGGYSDATIQTRTINGTRKVVSAKDQDNQSIEGSYVAGRVDRSGMDGFPLLHARAAREDGVGLVVEFSDKPLANEPFESLVKHQHVLRAVAPSEYSGQYSFAMYELGGPGAEVTKFPAGNSTSNPSIDDKEVAGLIKLEDEDSPMVRVNFTVPLKASGG